MMRAGRFARRSVDAATRVLPRMMQAGSSRRLSAAPNAGLSSEQLMEKERAFGAKNYHPLPMVFARAEGTHVWDPEGKQYYDFLSAYSAVNQGHNHPKIVQALKDQLDRCALSSRAFYNDAFPRFAEYITNLFGFGAVLPINSGGEAAETAVKLCRKWGAVKKGISLGQCPGNCSAKCTECPPEGCANPCAGCMGACGPVIISADMCFHGRTINEVSFSTDPGARDGFGPYLPGHVKVPFNDVGALEAVLNRMGDRVAAFLIEPIQGEAGVNVPDDGYLARCAELCKKHNVLLCCDEIQTGLARTGKMLAGDWDGVRPDVLVLGKALSGGLYPVSAVLADREIMDVIGPGQHGSTFGGNPIGSAVGIASLEVLVEEELAEKARVNGEFLRQGLRDIQCDQIQTVRGKGLLNAIDVRPGSTNFSAWDICLLLKERGLLCKPTHDHIIRLAPPLVIEQHHLEDCLSIIQGVFNDLPNLKPPTA